jgi:hypothetical protein
MFSYPLFHMKPYLGYVTFALLLGGCASSRLPAPPVVLENTGTEYPTMCMLLQPDGSLLFRGGFAFYNPGVWRRADNNKEILIVTLGGTEPFPAPVLKEQLPKKIGGLISFDEKRREMTYRFDAKTEFLNFGNFYFYRAETCHAH